MSAKFSSFKQYATGLTVTLGVFGISYLLITSIDPGNLSPVPVLFVGLLVGHFLGHVFSGAITSDKRHNRKADNAQQTKTIYVGNLPFKTNRYELKELFQPYGKVEAVRIMIDKATRKPRGYGFVEMPHDDANKAIAKLDGVSFIGRNLKISEANERA
ncbi:MAG: RNA-binding protein [Gammaproteobacteria bacterium]|jgi:hypothetical protein